MSLSLSLLGACTASTAGDASSRAKAGAGAATGDLAPPPQSPQPSTPQAKLAIASVQIVQDCPDPPAAPAKPSSRSQTIEQAKREFMPGGMEIEQPCTQSNMQLTLESTSQAELRVEIKALRLMSKGVEVGQLKARAPTAWAKAESSYKAWDEQLGAGGPLKASYKLSLPDWAAVERALGSESFGPMFTLELDISVGGQLQTLTSPAFPRERPYVIET